MAVTPIQSRSQGPLLSRTSLLIFGAFFVGAVVQRAMPAPFEAYVLSGGVISFGVAIGLFRVIDYRRKRRAEFAQQQAEWLLEHRMSKHLSLHHTPRPKFTEKSDWQQYVSVPSGK